MTSQSEIQNPKSKIIRPRLGVVLLFGGLASIALLMVEGSGAPGSTGLHLPRHFDKLLHFGAHLWVSTLMFWGLVLLGRPRRVPLRVGLACGLVLLADGLSGVAVEWVQATLGAGHGRQPDVKDVIANLLGTSVALAGGVAVIIHRQRRDSGY